MTPPAVTWDLLLGPFAALVLALVILGVTAYAGYRGWFYSGRHVRELREDYKAALRLQSEAANRVGEAIGKEVTAGIEKAVSRGIEYGLVKGVLKLNGKTVARKRRRKA